MVDMRLRKQQPLPDHEGYYDAVPTHEVAPGRLTPVEVAGEPILLTRLDGKLVAFSGLCPHAAGNLIEGEFYRGRIDCPDHGYRFDVLSGRVIWPEDEVCRLRLFAVKEVEGQVRVKVA